MTRLNVTIDQRRIREIQRMFRGFPGEAQKVLQHSINRVAQKTRKLVVDRVAWKNPGMKKKDIRKSVRLGRRATRSRLSATVLVRGPGIPAIKMGAQIGRKTKWIEELDARQSAWLFFNVFKARYGASAVFSTNYKVTRKVHKNISYVDDGKRIRVHGGFVATMPSGHKGIFKRREGFGGRAIREVRGPSIAEMLLRTGTTLLKIETEAGKGLEREIDMRVKSYLERARLRSIA